MRHRCAAAVLLTPPAGAHAEWPLPCAGKRGRKRNCAELACASPPACMDAMAAPASYNEGSPAEAPESPPHWYKQLASQQWQPTALQWPLPSACSPGLGPLSPPQAGCRVTCNVTLVPKSAQHSRQDSRLASALWSTSSTSSSASSN